METISDGNLNCFWIWISISWRFFSLDSCVCHQSIGRLPRKKQFSKRILSFEDGFKLSRKSDIVIRLLWRDEYTDYDRKHLFSNGKNCKRFCYFALKVQNEILVSLMQPMEHRTPCHFDRWLQNPSSRSSSFTITIKRRVSAFHSVLSGSFSFHIPFDRLPHLSIVVIPRPRGLFAKPSFTHLSQLLFFFFFFDITTRPRFFLSLLITYQPIAGYTCTAVSLPNFFCSFFTGAFVSVINAHKRKEFATQELFHPLSGRASGYNVSGGTKNGCVCQNMQVVSRTRMFAFWTLIVLSERTIYLITDNTVYATDPSVTFSSRHNLRYFWEFTVVFSCGKAFSKPLPSWHFDDQPYWLFLSYFSEIDL